MAGVFGSLEIARRALLAHQLAQRTTGQNVANAATPGYTRQRAELQPSSGNFGVDVAAIRRIRDRYLDLRLTSEQADLARSETQHTILQRLQSLFDPSETGLGGALDRFFNAMQDLATNPTDLAVRAAVRETGRTLSTALRNVRSGVDTLKTDLATEISSRVNDANSLLTQIADLNRQIIGRPASDAPNDLLDRRDQLVTELGKIIGASVTDRADGSIQVAVAGTGVLLVDGTRAVALAATTNLVTDTVDVTAGGVAITPQSGRLAPLVNARNAATGLVKQATADLNSLAKTIIERVNRLHSDGAGLTMLTSAVSTNQVSAPATPLTAAGLPFTPVTGSFQIYAYNSTGSVVSSGTVSVTAGVTTLNDVATQINTIANMTATVSGNTITVNAGAGFSYAFANDTSDALLALGLNGFFKGSDSLTIDLNDPVANDVAKIAAARADAAGLVHAGDGTNALDMARLRTALTMNSGTSSFHDFLGSVIGRVGSQTVEAQTALEAREDAVVLAQGLRDQVSGVSLDEEMTTLIQAQQAYEAAARYVRSIQDTLDALLAMI
jgi:flagellar hook-associated protein 1 FlgK